MPASFPSASEVQTTSSYISTTDPRFPDLLKAIPEAPIGLHYLGTWNEGLLRSCLAVVGSRRMSQYGARVINKLVGELAGLGITIVSGFMFGVDACAHSSAIKFGGKTIAVMPCGADVLCPSHQRVLYSSIIESGGLILSEYEDGTAPQKWTFPHRNRIIAGLCQATLIIEAGLNSGSLITARYALNNRRTVFVVPGDIFSVNTQGIYQLIKEGATIATSAQDIGILYGLNSRDKTNFVPERAVLSIGVEDDEHIINKLFEQLQLEPLDADELAKRLDVDIRKTTVLLSQLTLRGLITENGNGIYYAS